MSERVIVSCTHPGCAKRVRVPVGRAGNIKCPSCRRPFFADTRKAAASAPPQAQQFRAAPRPAPPKPSQSPQSQSAATSPPVEKATLRDWLILAMIVVVPVGLIVHFRIAFIAADGCPLDLDLVIGGAEGLCVFSSLGASVGMSIVATLFAAAVGLVVLLLKSGLGRLRR